jgi:predicted phosphodiesterase
MLPRLGSTEDVNLAIATLGKSRGVIEAAQSLAAELGRDVSRYSLKAVFAARGLAPPSSYLPQSEAPAAPEVKRASPPHRVAVDTGDEALIARIIERTRKGVSKSDILDRCRVWPAKLDQLLAEVKRRGGVLEEADGVVAWKEPARGEPKAVDVPPVSGGRVCVAVISDTHFGSQYCMPRALEHFIDTAYKAGCRVVFHCGDILDGCYDHSRFHLSHHGIDAQAEYAAAMLPRRDGLKYYFITGNHDETFTLRSGVETGLLIEDRFRRHGRSDVEYLGCRGGIATLGQTRVELWHPAYGRSYARSYRLQKHIEEYGVGQKPDLLLVGHFHQEMAWEERGVRAFGIPCFKSALAPYEKSKGLGASQGGIILWWEATAHGTLRRVGHERLAYWEREQPRVVALPPGISAAELG